MKIRNSNIVELLKIQMENTFYIYTYIFFIIDEIYILIGIFVLCLLNYCMMENMFL